MKSRNYKAVGSFFLAFLFCCALFFAISFAVLYEPKPKQNTTSNAVAANQAKEFCLYLSLGEKVYTLDIKPQQTSAFLETARAKDFDKCDRTVSLDKATLRTICERLGGIDYTENGTKMKLTGQHFIDYYNSDNFDELFKLVLTKVFKSRDSLSISYSVLTNIADTDISYMDFYENADYLVGITVY